MSARLLYRVFDIEVELDAPGEVLEVFDRLYGALRSTGPGLGPASVRLQVRTRGDAYHLTTPWDSVVASPAAMPAHLFAAMRHSVLRVVRSHCLLHAAALDVGGRGLILAGGAGTGKSALAVALAGRGARMLSDEIAAIELGTGRLDGLGCAAGVRPDIQALLDLEGEPLRWGDETRLILPLAEPAGPHTPRPVHPQMAVLLTPPEEADANAGYVLDLAMAYCPDGFPEAAAGLPGVRRVHRLDGRAYCTLRVDHDGREADVTRALERAARVHGALIAGRHSGRSAPIDGAASPIGEDLPRQDGLQRLLSSMINLQAVGADATPGRGLIALSRLLPHTRFCTLVPGRLNDTAAWIFDRILLHLE